MSKVAAAILAAVEGGILPPGKNTGPATALANWLRLGTVVARTAGLEARLYGR